MAIIPCPNQVDCEGSDFPITNYSAEGAEQQPVFFSLYFPSKWDKMGCLSLCESTISQLDADLCALKQEAQCQPGLFYSRSTTCSCVSYGGSEFFITVPGEIFSAETQEAADALAHAYACSQCSNPLSSIQIVGIDACTCFAIPYSSRIQFTGTQPVIWTITDGSLPPGLTLNPGDGTIFGTPNSTGTYSFTIRAFTRDGNYATRTMSIAVIAISTTAIPDIELGVPYSYQLTAVGGSGNYAWKLGSGTLPTGLTVSSTGLISGTPTAIGTSAVSFYVIDLTCEGINRTFFVPQARVTGRSRTTIAEVKGFSEFFPYASTPPKKYMVRTYGTSMSGNDAAGNPVAPNEAASAYFRAVRSVPGYPDTPLATWYVTAAGQDAINAAGETVSQAALQLYTSCPGGNFAPMAISPTDYPYQYPVLGWCFQFYQCNLGGMPVDCAAAGLPFPSIICSTCSDPAVPVAGANLLGFVGNGTVSTAPYNGRPHFTSATHGESNQDGNDVLGIFGNLTYIPSQANLGYPWITDGTYFGEMAYKSAWTVDLSVEYTDALALANATVYTSNGLVAQSKPRTTGFVSTWTTVDYTVHCTNLLEGEDYVAIVYLRGDDGSVTTIPYAFTAVGTTHDITASVPTPAEGHSTIVSGATISYAN